MTSTPLQLPPSEGRDEPSGHHGRSVDASAALAAAKALSEDNARADSVVNVDMTTSPISDLSLALGSTTSASASPIAFRSCTIAPSPPAPPPAPEYYSTDDSTHLTLSPEQLPHSGQPALRLQTDIPHPTSACAAPVKSSRRPRLNLRNKSSAQSLRPVSRTPSLKTAGIYSSLGSASATSSAVPSPVISAMGDITPLPSPLLATDSPGPWKRRTSSREMALPQPASAPLETNDHTPASTDSKKAYGGLTSRPPPTNDTRQPRDGGLAQPQVSAHHARNRSISEYIPDPITVPKRMSTVSGVRAKPDPKTSADGLLRREPHLSEARGLTPIEKPPTPPPSESSLTAGDSSAVSGSSASTKPPGAVFFEARGRYDQKRRRWLAIRVLGQGTFSQVYLATSHTSSSSSGDEDVGPGAASASLRAPDEDPAHQRRSLVAVKICEHGPRGGASEDRIEMSLKRELEIMQSVRHQSLVNLKAWSIERTRAILVLSYYPGGDLFDVATRHVDLLTPSLIRRMFSELVGAVNYLHGQNIVHRDIKLENVLVNLPPSELSPDLDWTTYPYSVITLTDLGLSRRIAPDEKLETRCGSDDYAAPEVIMGQPYDGRATDAWSLGVLLYALLEARLPFDPPPSLGPHGVDYAMQMRMRSRTSHRIARVEWRWYAYGAGEDDEGEGDHEADLEKFKANGLLGAMEVVEGLLKRARSRWPLAKVAETEWVGKGVRVEGGIRFREEEEGEEV